MNIYEKLVEARVRLNKKEIKKTGKNKFSNYDYYQLQDFIPTILDLEKELKFISIFNKGKENAEIVILDLESPEDKIVFVTDVKEAKLKGAHEVQNLGAEHTYIKRYLYMNVFEITEGEVLDSEYAEKEQVDGKKVESEFAKMQKNNLADEILLEVDNDKALALELSTRVAKELGFKDWSSVNLTKVSKEAFKANFLKALKEHENVKKAGL